MEERFHSTFQHQQPTFMLPPPAHFSFISLPTSILSSYQACELKFRFRELTSGLCSAATSAVCFEGRTAVLDATETGNELSQPKFEFTSLLLTSLLCSLFQEMSSLNLNLSLQASFL